MKPIIAATALIYSTLYALHLTQALSITGGKYWQQGDNLVGTGAQGSGARQGAAVALSADGSTLAVGGPKDVNADSDGKGAVWVFTRSAGGIWGQQGVKLVGVEGSSYANQGTSVAISADGNTILSGAPGDNSAWVFKRSGSTWSQFKGPIVINDNNYKCGEAVSMTAAGDMVALGCDGGGAYIYHFDGTAWTTQTPTRLKGTTSSQTADYQGSAIALNSADGTTLASGAPGDSYSIGGVFVFVRLDTSSTTWYQQGSKLVGSVYAENQYQGFSVALSADGNQLASGGYGDYTGRGAVWVFLRLGGGTTWTPINAKLVGTNADGSFTDGQGSSLAFTKDGSFLAGGSAYNGVYFFARGDPVWQQNTQVLSEAGVATSDHGDTNNFGIALAMSADGNTVVVGNSQANSRAGRVSVFSWSNTTSNPNPAPTKANAPGSPGTATPTSGSAGGGSRNHVSVWGVVGVVVIVMGMIEL